MKQPCIICNKEARDALPEGARRVTQELVREMAHDVVPWLKCWNCFGSGFTGVGERSQRAEIRQRIKEHRHSQAQKENVTPAGPQTEKPLTEKH